jgi:hypothetical protein
MERRRRRRRRIGVEVRRGARRMRCGEYEQRIWICWEDYVRFGTLVAIWTTRIPTMRVASWVISLIKDATGRWFQ